MFESISRGYGFLKQSIAMANADRDLIKPSLGLVAANIVVTLVFAAPMAAVFFATQGDTQTILMGVLGALLIFVQHVVTYFFSGLTIALIYEYLTQGDGRIPDAMAAVRQNFGGILMLALISTVLRVIENAAKERKNVIASILAGILEQIWTTASYLILPAMVIENLTLVPAVKRTASIVKNNLLTVAVGYVGVGLVTGLISFLYIILTGLIAFAAGAALAQIDVLIGIVVGVLIFGAAIALLSAIMSYITTAYYTCLFMWARSNEQARTQGLGAQPGLAPAPLAAVLG